MDSLISQQAPQLPSKSSLLQQGNINLRSLIEDTVRILSNTAREKQLELTVQYPDDVPRYIIADNDKLRHELTNPLSHAIQSAQQDHILIQIRDITHDDNVAHLAITASDTNKASLFSCTLPLTRQNTRQKPSPWLARYAHLKILVVDDLEARANAICKIVNPQNCNGVKSDHAIKTLSDAAQGGAPYAIVIIDEDNHHMPTAELVQTIIAQPSFANPLVIVNKHPTSMQQQDKQDKRIPPFYLYKPILSSEIIGNITQHWQCFQAQQLSPLEQIKQLKPRILLVEDDAIGRRVATLLLEEVLGCHLDLAACANEAITFVREQAHYDLVFMDIGLPDMDGLKTTRIIRSMDDPDYPVPIVALTAHVYGDTRERCQAAGMNHHLTKPTGTEDLLATLARFILQRDPYHT